MKSALWVKRRLVPPASKSTIFGVPVAVLITLDRSDDDIGISTPPRKPHGDLYALKFTKMIGDFRHQQVAEQGHILLLLVGRSETPEAAKTEPRNIVNVHS
jgi:hypothetical protein